MPDVTGGAMRAVAAGIAYRAVRNRGTIGGSLVHADPSADWVSALAALGASAVVRGGQRGAAHSRSNVHDRRVRKQPRPANWSAQFKCRAVSRRALGLLQGVPEDRRVRPCHRRLSPRSGPFGLPRRDRRHRRKPIVFADATGCSRRSAARQRHRCGARAHAMTAHGLTDPIDQQIHLAALRRAIARANGS